MGKITHREITNEDGSVYGICGNVTRLGAYRAIRQDIKSWGLEDDVEFTQDELEECDYWETDDPNGEYENYIWWSKPKASLNPKYIGKGWIYRTY